MNAMRAALAALGLALAVASVQAQTDAATAPLPVEHVLEVAAAARDNAQEEARVLRDLDAGPPGGMTSAEVDTWWAQLFQRAAALRGEVGYRVAEARYRARGDNPYAVHQWSISQLHRGRVDEFRRLSERAWSMARQPVPRAGFAATTASWSLAMLGDLESAERWLKRADEDLARASAQHPELGYARSTTLGARARWLAARGQFADARRTAQEALDVARAYLQGLARMFHQRPTG